ncbi:hypothetical protein MLD38_027019 [Melastoma candidum]|uniref:Uncharacterized protein n=1 Tax=Melastoma candidum TaxID=119954 RepID=A0ACB9P1F8_9MYRT|nr:hypothetical protein MLD38_027019 [Melastoma candidum]
MSQAKNIVRALEGDVSLDDLHGMVKQGNCSTFDGSTGSYGEGLRSLRKKGTDSQVGMSSEDYGGATTGEYDQSHSRGAGRQI